MLNGGCTIMGISFETPVLLWLLIGNIFFLWLPYKLGRQQNKFYTGVRILVYSLLVLGVSGVSFVTEAKESHTIILMDQSDSMATYETEISDFINKSLSEKKDKDYVEIISFGDNYGIEQIMTNKEVLYKTQSIIDKRGTDLQEAFTFAMNRLDDEKNKRIFLISDFKETSGDLITELLKESDTTIEYKHYQPEKKVVTDAQIVSVEMPVNVRQGERFSVAVSVYSNESTSGTLTIYNEDQLALEKEVTLKPGIQRFVFEDQLASTGAHKYIAYLDATEDEVIENNKWHNIVQVEGPPKLLVIDPKNEGAAYKALLLQQGFQLSYFNQPSADYSLEALAAYDGVVLVNVSIEEVSINFLEALELYVKELGGGLLAVGGGESYAVGGYENTILEEILPVNMALKVDGERYDLAMMVVVDKSGSMMDSDRGPSRIKMAKEAVMRVTQTLSGKDQLGVTAFDSQPYEVLPLTPVTEMDSISKKVAGIKADGGTSILPALEQGLTKLQESSHQGKHLLLVSDGQGEQRGFEALIKKYPDITISTIAIGEGADAATMERIANYGKGRFYQVLDYRKIPEIFTKETRLAMDEYIKEGSFVPKKTSYHPIVKDVVQLPLVYGYVSTSIKPQADLLLSVEEEPLLTTWQYGLGKTMAWASDVNSWTQLYFQMPQGVQLLTDMPGEILSSQSFDKMKLDTSVVNNQLRLNGMIQEEAVYDFSVLTGDGETYDVDVDQYSDGYFEGALEIPEEGFLSLRVLDEENNQLVNQLPIAVNYSKEYDKTYERTIIEDYSRILDSKALTSPSELFSEIEENTSSTKNYGDWFVIIGLILFVVDIGVRKLRFDPIQRIMMKKQSQSIEKEVTQKPQVKETEKKTPEKVDDEEDEVIDIGRLLSNKRKREL